ncbi:IclR family transcriptional regulator [Phytoactinopolyspora halotolerans]|uniref:IclR family transcriptional regulator n=1 Tax=Phytoactinopolyspora halotolerans TaxID=1981512 RepID=A0A6L9S957_9ACTN|nr:IclR family transcriptional regulator [Phytoactinopolyspora halotolerans]NEE01068.1 IclR family transcriptional regulator [Phytoactinopolyspora halotolerans]
MPEKTDAKQAETHQNVGAQPVRSDVPSGSKRTAAGRVLALLGAFANGRGSMTLSEISRHADLTLTTTHRLVREVLEWGGLEVDDTGHYRLSRKILDLASASTQALQLRETALPHLMDLHRRTGLNVNLAVRDGLDVMYLEALRSHPNYTGANKMGGRLRLHITATGLVLLAYADENVLDEYLREPLKRYTPNTIADVPTLKDCLREIRRNRYAIAHQFVVMEVGSVAAPVMGVDGTVETAVGMVYVADQHDPRRLADQVRLTANRISRELHERNTALDPRTIDFNRRHAGLI